MAEDPVIRRFRADEAEAWRTVRLAALRDAPDAYGDTYEAAAARPLSHFVETVAGDFPPFGAFLGADVVGTAGFYVMSGSKVAHRGVLWGMYVAPGSRRRGIGERLIGAVLAEAGTSVDQVHLHVVATNTTAYALYRRMGFVAYGIEPRALRHEGVDHDEVLMVRTFR